MDLKTFVADTLTQIVEGVAEAKDRLAAGGTGAKINPTTASDIQYGDHATPIEFDVAVTVAKERSLRGKATGTAGGTIIVAQMKATADAEGTAMSSNREISRVKFKVMLAQPAEAVAPGGGSLTAPVEY